MAALTTVSINKLNCTIVPINHLGEHMLKRHARVG